MKEVSGFLITKGPLRPLRLCVMIFLMFFIVFLLTLNCWPLPKKLCMTTLFL